MSVTTTQAHTKNIIITRLAYTISRLSQHHLLLVIVRATVTVHKDGTHDVLI